MPNYRNTILYKVIQEGNVNISADDSVGHCDKKKFTWNMRLILNGFRDAAVWTHKHKRTVNGDKEREITS